MTTKQEIEKRLEDLEQNFERILSENAQLRLDVAALEGERTDARNQLTDANEKLAKYVKLVDAIREVVPVPVVPLPVVAGASSPIPGDTQRVDLTVPQYDVNVEVDPVKFNFKKDDLKSQVLYGINLTKGRKRLSDIKETMIDRGYKKAVDEITGLLTELEQAGLVLEFDQDKSHKGYKLTPNVIWHFPEEKDE